MSIEIFDGFSGKPAGELACADGGGRIDCYALFDGVTAMRLRLETSGFAERRERRGGLEINFCANGRFESDFSPRDRVALTPGDMALSLLDGVHGALSESRFPLGYYEGVCLTVDCAPAAEWMARNVAPLRADFEALRRIVPAGRWYVAGGAGPRCEHVFRELFENLPYFDREYLRLKALELFMLPRGRRARPPAPEAPAPRRSAPWLRSGYVSLAELAREHRISVTRLQKLFKQVYGVPVYHYLREYRLEQAAVELSRSEKRVVDVAMDAGYDSASKFAAAFRERYGVTPSAFRAASASKWNNPTKME